MAYEDSQSIINDALFRSGEIPGSSDWDGKAIEYLNRAYSSICNGTSEFLPEHIDDWWWMRAKGVVTLEPIFETGTVAVVQGSSGIVFSSAPPASVVEWRLKVDGHPDIFAVASHIGADTAASLDSPYTGPTNSAAVFRLMKVVYDLGDIGTVISPMISFRENEQIFGISPERMDFLYPLQRMGPGVPQAFTLMDDTTVRFSHAGRTDNVSMRIEYRYKTVPALLTNSPGSIPILPRQYRHVLADLVTFQIMFDKNDDRAPGVSQGARGILKAMHAEHLHSKKKMDHRMGHIFPRASHTGRRGPLRTESGLIIG